MAILPIRVLPDPILRKEARPIDKIDAAVQKLAADMIETMEAGFGVGLAGPQVGILKRIVTIQTPELDAFAMINPVVTARSGSREVREGCLSMPGWLGIVTRAVTVTARALDTAGDELQFEDAADLLAQAIEHEVDHLNGILFTDHLRAHMDLWKAGEEPAVHDHQDIDFDHDAAHGRVLSDEERAEIRADGAAGPEEQGEEADEAEAEDDEPVNYAELAVYREADLERLDIEMRRIRALGGVPAQ